MLAIDDSKYIEEECKKYGFIYFDLALDYDTELDRVYKYLVAK